MADMLNDYLIIDGSEDPADEFEYFAALQRQINNGSVWRMQGSCGRAAMGAIEGGYCMCGHVPHQDYWGNWVPARSVLQPGTKGSYDFVREAKGVQWADRMAAIDQPQKEAE